LQLIRLEANSSTCKLPLVMICPQCNAEYRPGFTRCADCGVELFDNGGGLAVMGSGKPPEPGDPNEDPFCSFWGGEDPHIHAELCAVLDEAGVPHHTVFRRDHLFNLSNYPTYEVGVPFSLFENAETAVKQAFGTDDVEGRETLNSPRLMEERSRPVIRKLPVSITPADAENIPGPPRSGQEGEWFSDEATACVWSTEKGEPGSFLVAALHENGIRCRLDQNRERAELYVLPQDESRAREIIREVVEGEPPK
jgi:hypothetical protein